MNGFLEIRQILARFHIQADPQVFLTVFTLVMARMGAAVRFVPFLGGTTVPGNIQVALTVLVATILYPFAAGNPGRVPSFGLYFALLLKEILVGSLMGLLVQIVFAAVEAAGTLVEFGAGLKPQDIMAPQTPPAASNYGRLLGQAAIVLYLTADVHLVFIQSLADSYGILPLMEFPSFRSGFPALAMLTGRITGGFVLVAFQISAPIIFLLALIQVGSNLAFRTSFVGVRQDPFQPLASVAICGAIFLSVGLMSRQFIQQGGTYLAEVRQFLQGLR